MNATESARLLTSVLKPLFEKSILEIWLLPSLSTIAAIAASVAAYYSYRLSKSAYSAEIQKMFFNIMFQFPHSDDSKRLTLRQKELICNYFEFVSYLFFQGKLSNHDMYLLSEIVRQTDYVSYAKEYQKRWGEEKFKYYLRYVDSYLPNKGVGKGTKDKQNGRILLYISMFFLFAAFLITIPYKLVFFILSGIFSGLFYGRHNHEVWPDNIPHEPGIYERTHFYWVHTLGGITGGVSLYLLSNRFHFNDSQLLSIGGLGWEDVILFLVTILGYSGYIPRTLWFFANKGGLDAKLSRQ